MNRLITVLISITMMGCFGKQPENTKFRGTELPSFNILLTDSVSYINTKNIVTGKPVVILYFGPHCPYSRAQVEDMIHNMDLLKNINIYLITTWPYLELKKFYEHYQLSQFKNVTVGLDYENFFHEHYNAPGVPYMAIYTKDKKLSDVFVGEVEANKILEVAERE